VKVLFFLLSFVVLSACQTTPKCGPEIRAAFDVGSGSTKIKVVEINTCSQELTQVVLEDQVKVDYRDALEKDMSLEFSEKIQQEGLVALEKLKGEAQAKGARKFVGIATAAFRQAKNTESFVKLIREKLGISLRVISQSDEALLGFQAARERVKVRSSDLVVWDIGGGSQQMISVDESVKPTIYYGKLASVSFKNQVIGKIQKRDALKVESPNPIKKSQLKNMVELAETEAKSTVPVELQKKLSTQPGVVVVGIGGVLAKSVPRQLAAGSPLNQNIIKAALDIRSGMTDQQINDPYSATEITNLALVYGFMKALGIKSYQSAEVSLVDALWFDAGVWP
jgi:exopolyphosphatase/guanosine-5'-triphosphate,3'-diphosphate pyrophosphatase